MKAPASADTLPQERQDKILQQLKARGRVVANDLAAEFGVSEDSIRRDLRDMAARGLCRRVYGGALLPTPEFAPLPQRVHTQDASRSSLAAYAASLVQPGQVCLLDAGATNVEIARCLRGRALTVLTNAPAVAQVLAGDAAVELVVIGGKVDPRSGGAVGSQALAQLTGLQADVCIPGTCAVDIGSDDRGGGAWGINAEESAFKQAMIRASAATIVIASDDKVGARGSYRFADLARIDHLVVSDGLPADLMQALASAVTQLHAVSTGQQNEIQP